MAKRITTNDLMAALVDFRDLVLAQFGRIDARFERIDARFERIDAQFERVFGEKIA